MKKIIAVAFFAAISIVGVSGSANAASAKSTAEFKSMIANIHASEAHQRAEILRKLIRVQAINAKKVHPGKSMNLKFLSVIEKIENKQAMNRALVLALIKKNRRASVKIA